jgi:hypothetical protein
MMAQADRSINSIFDGGDSSVDVLLTILALAAPVGRRAGVGCRHGTPVTASGTDRYKCRLGAQSERALPAP